MAQSKKAKESKQETAAPTTSFRATPETREQMNYLGQYFKEKDRQVIARAVAYLHKNLLRAVAEEAEERKKELDQNLAANTAS